jgi:hypothetical protein
MSKVQAVAATVVLMLCASVSDAQQPFSQSSNPGSYVGFAQTPSAFGNTSASTTGSAALTGTYRKAPWPGRMYVACWAEVPSHSTAYFSPTFPAPAVSSARKEFRELVTTQYGAVSQVQCVGKFNPAVVKDTVQQWQDKARATNNAIIDTDWQPTAASDQGSRDATKITMSSAGSHSDNGRMKQTRAEMQTFPHLDGIPGGSVPGNNSSGTVAGQSNFQR